MAEDLREVSSAAPQCRFGDGPACGLFETPDGCVCYPDDRQQYLCCYHAEKFPDGYKIERIENIGGCE